MKTIFWKIRNTSARTVRTEHRHLTGHKGFTLIELLVVVAILGSLAAIAVPAVARFANKGKLESQRAEWQSVQIAVDAYIADRQIFQPTTGTSGKPPVADFTKVIGIDATDDGAGGAALYPAYIRNPAAIAGIAGYCLDVNGAASQMAAAAATVQSWQIANAANCP
jgi:prepilin-type N-terminal cleavage/methylation domain-containing protein